GGPTAMIVLGLFAEARQKDIAAAQREKKPWPKEWLADVNAADALLENHPFGDDSQGAAHGDFPVRLEAREQAEHVLDQGLLRFPDSFALHKRLRNRLLAERGGEGLIAWYEQKLAANSEPKDAPILEWYAGYACLVAAESAKRSRHDDVAVAD